jgi:hypothetical protein
MILPDFIKQLPVRQRYWKFSAGEPPAPRAIAMSDPHNP